MGRHVMVDWVPSWEAVSILIPLGFEVIHNADEAVACLFSTRCAGTNSIE